MTDWLPWGFVFGVTVFAALAIIIRRLQSTPVGSTPDLGLAWRVLLVGGIVSLAVYLLYLVFQERWLWY